MSMPCPHVHYSSTMLLLQGQYAIYMCSDIILLISINHICYDLKPLELGKRTTLVLSNIRELDRKLFYKLVYLYSSTGGPC